MSGVVKGVKKVFKTVGKIVKKVWKPLVIAAAVYFTAGAALSYFGAAGAGAATTAGAAGAGAAAGGAAAGSVASMVGAGGAAATGVVTSTAAGVAAGSAAASSVAATMAGSGVAAGAFTAAHVSSVAQAAFTRTATSMALNRVHGVKDATRIITTPTSPMAANTAGAAPGVTPPATPPADPGEMTPYERSMSNLMWSQTLISGVSGLLSPKPPTADQAARANARFRGSYFGVNERGVAEFDPAQAYGEFLAPRAGESYRGAIPDRGIIQPAASATASAGGAPAVPVATSRPVLANRQQQAPNFIDPENAGAYSPDDTYGIT